MKRKVLILCTGNSCRSQMAQGIFMELGNQDWESYSAGTQPVGYVHPLAIEVMEEIGIDISENVSKGVELYQNEHWDLVITVCDNAGESCAVLNHAEVQLHWPFADPADGSGDHQQLVKEFRRVRDQIHTRVARYMGIPS